MRRLVNHRPSPALLIALLSLFVALGGTVYAATTLPKNSVGTKQIKNKAVTRPKLDPGLLSSLEGKAGANGANGTNGANGSNGTNGTNGVAVIQRTTGSGTPGDADGDSSNITLSNASFTNPAANTDNLFFVKATFTPPATCTTGDSPFISFGGQIDSTHNFGGGGGPFTPGSAADTVDLGVGSITAPGVGPHTLTLTFDTNCTGGGQTGTITNVVIDTAAVG